jgi:hypothetical protein
MKKILIVLALIVGFTFIGCDTSTNSGTNPGDGGGAVARADLVGTWHKNGNGYPRLTLNANDSWSGYYSIFVGTAMTSTWSVSGSTLKLGFTDGEHTYTIALSEDKKTLIVSSIKAVVPLLSIGNYVKQ